MSAIPLYLCCMILYIIIVQATFYFPLHVCLYYQEIIGEPYEKVKHVRHTFVFIGIKYT